MGTACCVCVLITFHSLAINLQFPFVAILIGQGTLLGKQKCFLATAASRRRRRLLIVMTHRRFNAGEGIGPPRKCLAWPESDHAVHTQRLCNIRRKASTQTETWSSNYTSTGELHELNCTECCQCRFQEINCRRCIEEHSFNSCWLGVRQKNCQNISLLSAVVYLQHSFRLFLRWRRWLPTNRLTFKGNRLPRRGINWFAGTQEVSSSAKCNI